MSNEWTPIDLNEIPARRLERWTEDLREAADEETVIGKILANNDHPAWGYALLFACCILGGMILWNLFALLHGGRG